MPGTRTAPTVDGLGQTFKALSLRWMDYTGDLRTDTFQILSAATPAEMEAFAAAMQAASNATLYEIKVADVYASIPDSQNALEEVWENATDNIVYQAKLPDGTSSRIFVPSPIESQFIDTTDMIDPTSPVVAAVIAAWTPLINPAYEVVGARFTSRRQINQQVKI